MSTLPSPSWVSTTPTRIHTSYIGLGGTWGAMDYVARNLSKNKMKISDAKGLIASHQNLSENDLKKNKTTTKIYPTT